MTEAQLPHLLTFYGLFLCACGILSVIFIGPKAKTALISGGTSGVLALTIAYLVGHIYPGAIWAAVGLSFMLFSVFAWRATKTFHKILELISIPSPDLKGKAIAFLIISLMAVVSLVVFMLCVCS